MSNAMPYVKWHGRDWLGDPLLRMVGAEARGVWIDLLCIMMDSEPYGHLAVKSRPMKDEEAAAMIGMDASTYKGILYRLEEAGIPSRTEAGMLYSRRLVRDHERFMTGRESGLKGGGNPRLRGKNTEARTKKPEAKGGIKVAYKGPDIPAALAANSAFCATWTEWMQFRRGMKAPKDWDAMFSKQLDWLYSQGAGVAVDVMQQSLRNGWQGLFPVRQAAKPQQGQNQPAAPSKPKWQRELDAETAREVAQ